MEKFISLGWIRCSGKLSDGSPWSGLRVPCALLDREGTPYKVEVFKAQDTDSNRKMLDDVGVGCIVSFSFDSKGRISGINS